MTASINAPHHRLTRAARLLVLAWMLVAAVGCASARRYSAANLPPQLQAPPIENAQTVDLSRFTGPAIGNDLIDCGDLLNVSIAASLDAEDVSEFLVRVGDDGVATLPDVGQIPLAGLHLMQAEYEIAAACVGRQLYRRPHVTVAMSRQRANRVTVVGGVEEPGVYELPRGSSYLAAAIMAAGGLAEDAGTQVQIQQPAMAGRVAAGRAAAGRAAAGRAAAGRAAAGRGSYGGPGGVQPAAHTTAIPAAPSGVIALNLTEAQQDSGGSEYLRDGSVITIEKRQPAPLRVIGLVQQPGEYDFPVNHNANVLSAIAQAGGLSSKLADSILVIRESPKGQGHVTIAVSYQRAKGNTRENLRLMPGDIVSVQETPATVALDIVYRMLRFSIGGSMALF